MIPIQRPNWPPDQIENAANTWITPITRMIQPQVLRSLKMKRWSSTKKFALSIAAMPQIAFKMPAISTMIQAKVSQPAP